MKDIQEMSVKDLMGVAERSHERKPPEKGKFKIDLKMILDLYFRIVMNISLIIICIGITALLKSGLSYLVNEEFSYRGSEVYPEGMKEDSFVNDEDI